jgi:hypothetical protein
MVRKPSDATPTAMTIRRKNVYEVCDRGHNIKRWVSLAVVQVTLLESRAVQVLPSVEPATRKLVGPLRYSLPIPLTWIEYDISLLEVATLIWIHSPL